MSDTEQRRPLRLSAFTFDPLTEKPDITEDMLLRKPTSGSEYYIIQFNKSLTIEERARIQSQYGLALINYIPEYAYLERINPLSLRNLEKDPLFRASIPYHPAFKVDPDIGKHVFVSEHRKSEPGILLLVIIFDGTKPKELANSIREFGFEVVSITEEPKAVTPKLIVRVGKPDDVKNIAQLREVKYIEEVGDVTLNNGTTSWVIQTNSTNSRTIWNRSLRGENQIIGHIDGPIDLNHCFFQDPANNTVSPSHRKVVGLRNASGGSTSQDHGTFSAGCAAGEDFNNDANSTSPNANNGNAPRARLTHGYLFDLLFTGGTISFYNYLVQAHNDGAHIHTNSWDDKSTSAYTQLSVDLDEFVWNHEDDLAIIGPDNNGTIRPPDTSKNALVVNATQRSPNQGNFSSGITSFSLDGRRKPDLMAPGQNIVSSDDATACGTRTASGTSFAAPAVSGTAALVRQYYTEGWYPTGALEPSHSFIPSGALLKATLLNATVDMTGITGYPGTAATGEGWGRLLLENALFFQGDTRYLRVWDVRHNDGLTTLVTHTYHVYIAANTQPLKICLVWTEPPGAVGSSSPVVNNLDLQVVSPDGTQTFLGNVFTGGVSTTGGSADTLNNVEMVLINSPALGDWTIRVTGTSVNVGNPGQGYALVVTGEIGNIITKIEIDVETGAIENAGTNGRVYLGICGREFRLDKPGDQFRVGILDNFTIGIGSNIENPNGINDIINSSNSYEIDTYLLNIFPKYIRFEPQDNDDNWNVSRVELRVTDDTSIVHKFDALVSNGSIWLGENSGLILGLT